MSAHKKPKLAHSDLNIEVNLDEVLKQSVRLLVNLINEEAVSRKTRTFWEVYLQILRQSFCTKSTVEFWGDHLRRMLKFLEMEPKVQSLLLALFTSRFTWHRQSQISDRIMNPQEVSPSFDQLFANGFIEIYEEIELEELLEMMVIDHLKQLCGSLKLKKTGTKLELIDAIRSHCKTKPLFSTMASVSVHVIKLATKIIGNSYRLEDSFRTLMLSILTVYSPHAMNSVRLIEDPDVALQSDFFYQIEKFALRKNKSSLEPDRVVRIKIYQDVDQLFEFVEAVQMESKMRKLAKHGKRDEAVQLAREVRSTVLSLLDSDSSRELLDYYKSLPDYLLKFTSLWIYVRCLSFGAEVMEKLRLYYDANKFYAFLLNRDLLAQFNHSMRGEFYYRMALNMDFHLKKKDDSLRICHICLEDPLVSNKYKLMLQDRIKTPGFQLVIKLLPFEEITITGLTLDKNLGDKRVNHFIYIDSDGSTVSCGVEEIALKYFLANGYSEGFHVEDRAWHFIYALVFCDILYDHSVESTWVSELQENPLDRNSIHFYTNRADKIDQRIEEVKNQAKFVKLIKENYASKQGTETEELNWSIFKDLNQLLRFLHCCPINMVVEIFERFSRDNRNMRSGFPDLFVWNVATGKMAAIEVKGPGDKLSTKQRLYLDFFTRQGIRSSVCHVKADKGKIFK